MPKFSFDWKRPLRRTAATLLFVSPFFLLITVTQVLKEYFPFSHFPMYDGMGSITLYVYIGDSEGNPLPAVPVTGERTSKLKRIYDTELRAIRDKLDKNKYDLTIADRYPAAIHTLEWLYGAAVGKAHYRDAFLEHESIRLYQSIVKVEDNKLVQPPAELVGEILITPDGPVAKPVPGSSPSTAP